MHREAYSQIHCFQNAINCCLMQPLMCKKNKSLVHGNSGRCECFDIDSKLEIIGFCWLSLQNIKIPKVLSKLLSVGNITQ